MVTGNVVAGRAAGSHEDFTIEMFKSVQNTK